MSFATVLKRLEAKENPYPGLRPFETEEAAVFFGREQHTSDLLARLEQNGFVAVIGVSGSGKSSLVRAGLIPALRRGFMASSGSRWRIVVTRPAGSPLASLEASLREAQFDPSPLRDSSYGLIHIAGKRRPEESILIVVDQFEEIFRYKDRVPLTPEGRLVRQQAFAEAHEFVQLLLAASRHEPPVYVVITMRSDYLGDCAEFRDLPEALNDGQYLIPRMTREQRKQAIVYPLRDAAIESALLERMLNDVGDEPDQLPILQHALMRTWAHWRFNKDGSGNIRVSDYDAIGGFDSAIDQHANELLARTHESLTRTIFKRLTALPRNRQERRDPATLGELWKLCGALTERDRVEVNAVIETFRQRDSTFLLPREGAIHSDTYIDIAHESLIRRWRILRDDWIPEEAKSVKTFITLLERARNWKSGKASLLSGLDLADARQWQEQRNQTGIWAKHYADEAAVGDIAQFVKHSGDAEGTDAEKAFDRYRRELDIASEIQQQLTSPAIPDVPFAQVKAVTRQCGSVGGDFFDVIYANDALTIVVADVSGKGIPAALLASTLQGIVYTQAVRETPLDDIVAALNTFMCGRLSWGGRFATLVIARITTEGRLTLINAGHVLPLMVSDATVKPVEAANMPVGLFPPAEFRSTELLLKAHDRLVLVTDGVTEAMDEQGEEFGDERLRRAALKGFEAIEREFGEFCGSSRLADDYTLLEVTYRGQ